MMLRNSKSKLWVSMQHGAILILFGGLFIVPTIFLSMTSILLGTIPANHHISDKEGLQRDPTLGGLISPNADKENCMSRGLIHKFRKASQHLPSPYLSARLRQYEATHKRCGPGTNSFTKATLSLILGNGASNITNELDCKYVVWLGESGLGNRIISIASTFVYALLTDRVLLVDGGFEVQDLFCEPFPQASWLLPSYFPYKNYMLHEGSRERFGHFLETTNITLNTSQKHDDFHPSVSYLNLKHSYDFYDKLVFCKEEQTILTQVPWLFLRSNLYFVPHLYLYVPQFREELERLFPDRDTIFHHIGRYLFFPTDSVWSWISRFYEAYLAGVNERVGVQIRVFDYGPEIVSKVSEEIFACAFANHIIPNVSKSKTIAGTSNLSGNPPSIGDPRRSFAVLITSLDNAYFEKMREMFLEESTENGEVVSVHQPSHEGYQQTGNMAHDKRAWAEICLLSFSDKLITSAWSTFGYVAHGLAGIKPWILKKVHRNETSGGPLCSRAKSMDLCFHVPPHFDCEARVDGDPSQVIPFVQQCEDGSFGIKVFNDNPSPT